MMVVVLLLARAGSAADTPGMVEVPTRAETPTPAVPLASPPRDASILAEPFVKDHPFAFSYGTRVLCLDVTASSFCMGGLQLGFAFKYGDVHAGAVGNVLSAPADGSLAPYGGVELGTRYYYVGARRGARPVALGFAFRGDLDLLGLMSFFRASSAWSYFAVANTYGGNVQLLIGSRFAITARAAVGWSDRVALSPGSTSNASAAGFAVDLGAGALARF